MKIAIDISRLQSGHKARGTGVYVRELLTALTKLGGKHTFFIVNVGQKVPDDADLVHYPYFDPFLLTLPIMKPKPTVVTVHDLIPLVFPQQFPKGVRGSVKWQFQRLSLGGSRRIITDSHASKTDIQRIIPFDGERIDVIPLAASSNFRPISDKLVLDRVRKKYRLPETFILYVGDINWNKNVLGLLEAYSLCMSKNVSPRPALVLVGSSFLNEEIPEVTEINKRIESLNIKHLIVRPGYVPDEELAALYCQAVCLIQPSKYEGFGFPILEAMASGCPVLSSNASSLAEIAGPASSFEPNDSEGIVSNLTAVLTLTKKQRQQVIQKGIAWSKQFTWQKVARATIDSYQKALT